MHNAETEKKQKTRNKPLHVSVEIYRQIKIMALTKGVTVNDIMEQLIQKSDVES